jgi:hypothetical protein
VAVLAFIHTGGGTDAPATASDSARVVSTRERRISARFAGV